MIVENKKIIVVSAVNIRKGGTLTILRDCLEYLSHLVTAGGYRVVALVHRREPVYYEGIEYIELPWTVKNWLLRLWCEYVTMHYISHRIGHVHLWLSLHDTTPRVEADRQCVYCQTSFPFYRWSLRDFVFDYKIVLFALFTRYAYRIRVKRNTYVIVQQHWLRRNIGRICGLPEERFVVAPPEKKNIRTIETVKKSGVYTFLFASTADVHKNFELLCRATAIVERMVGVGCFKVVITIDGRENRYARWLLRHWGRLQSMEFVGFLSKERLQEQYSTADCLVFPSKVETWGLPISEFMVYGKPMLLSDLPYAHETAAGSMQTAFFNPYHAADLAHKMLQLIEGDRSMLHPVKITYNEHNVVHSWNELFQFLMQ
jgi:glycosyltransferase involved in cell wall biosynthesis